MQNLSPIKRFIYAFCFVAIVAIVISVLIALLVNAFGIKNTEASPNVNGDIHSQVIHRSIIAQLLEIEGAGSGYMAATLRRKQSDITNTSTDVLNIPMDDAPYVGEITSTSGIRYYVEAELLTAGDEVIPVYIELSQIEEDEL